MTIKAECERCGETFDAPTSTWAYNKRTGEQADGGDGDRFFGFVIGPVTEADYWPKEDTVVYERQVGGVGTFGLCQCCIDKRYDAMQRAQQYMSPSPPAWFDESAAGERWSDDY